MEYGLRFYSGDQFLDLFCSDSAAELEDAARQCGYLTQEFALASAPPSTCATPRALLTTQLVLVATIRIRRETRRSNSPTARAASPSPEEKAKLACEYCPHGARTGRCKFEPRGTCWCSHEPPLKPAGALVTAACVAGTVSASHNAEETYHRSRDGANRSDSTPQAP